MRAQAAGDGASPDAAVGPSVSLSRRRERGPRARARARISLLEPSRADHARGPPAALSARDSRRRSPIGGGTLSKQGYLDDMRFARMFVQDKRELEQWGERADPPRAAGAGGSEWRGGDRQRQSMGWRHARPSSTAHSIFFGAGFRRRRGTGASATARSASLIRKGYDPELALDALAAYARRDGADCARNRPGTTIQSANEWPAGHETPANNRLHRIRIKP